MVIFFFYCFLRCKPDILLFVECKVEAGSCEAAYALVNIVKTLDNAVASLEFVDKLACLVAVLIGHNEFCLAAVCNDHFGILVNIAVSVTGDGDGLFPCGDIGSDAFDNDRRSENRTV